MEYKKYISEFIGTFALVFFGTGSVIVNTQSGWDLWLLWISLTFGIIVASIIYIFWSISWAHINPAVTIALAIRKKINVKNSVFYIIAQFIWALIASLLLSIIFPDNIGLWQTLPSWIPIQSLTIEIIMTFFLMLTILWITSNSEKNIQALAGLVIGSFIVAAILLSGPISGGSFNPARSLAPAIVSWNLSHIWIYLIWPIIGSVSAMYVWNYIKK